MRNHINANIYGTFYIMKDINYQLNNPLDTKKAQKSDINIRRVNGKSKITRKGNINFLI
ncbi:hypothetical protein [Methanobrevibacter sp.]|uniref:hypothetical protein n=1 Tax=Methanobrevibacter sp. TaxID=66852 RepID=UPI002E7A15E6|nr:hypothetical protein [Methanobrevibacter sp.]MEE1335559.1 hypothetical protein [Methanobrevibacter sp.]